VEPLVAPRNSKAAPMSFRNFAWDPITERKMCPVLSCSDVALRCLAARLPMADTTAVETSAPTPGICGKGPPVRVHGWPGSSQFLVYLTTTTGLPRKLGYAGVSPSAAASSPLANEQDNVDLSK
jgi:hypothetical protein